MRPTAWLTPRAADSGGGEATYLLFRDRIVLSNRKLIYRAV